MTLDKVYVGRGSGGAGIVPGTNKPVIFGAATSVTVPAGEESHMYAAPALIRPGSFGSGRVSGRILLPAGSGSGGWVCTEGTARLSAWGLDSLFADLVPVTVDPERIMGRPVGSGPYRMALIIEPTGPAWLPVAVFFIRRGHTVFRVSSAKAAALRRFLSRHAKSNRIDALVLARLPLVDPDGLVGLELAEGAQASLRRRARAADRLTEEISSRKQRIRDGQHWRPAVGTSGVRGRGLVQRLEKREK